MRLLAVAGVVIAAFAALYLLILLSKGISRIIDGKAPARKAKARAENDQGDLRE